MSSLTSPQRDVLFYVYSQWRYHERAVSLFSANLKTKRKLEALNLIEHSDDGVNLWQPTLMGLDLGDKLFAERYAEYVAQQTQTQADEQDYMRRFAPNEKGIEKFSRLDDGGYLVVFETGICLQRNWHDHRYVVLFPRGGVEVSDGLLIADDLQTAKRIVERITAAQ